MRLDHKAEDKTNQANKSDFNENLSKLREERKRLIEVEELIYWYFFQDLNQEYFRS